MHERTIEKASRLVRTPIGRHYLESMPPEGRLRSLTDEERLQGLSTEARLKGIPTDKILAYLSRLKDGAYPS